MAKAKSVAMDSPQVATNAKTKGYDEWEVREAMRTMMRAGEITKDKKLLGLVRKEATRHAAELQETAARAGQLARMGRISPKQMAKLASR
jgi:hypothetical protein